MIKYSAIFKKLCQNASARKMIYTLSILFSYGLLAQPLSPEQVSPGQASPEQVSPEQVPPKPELSQPVPTQPISALDSENSFEQINDAALKQFLANSFALDSDTAKKSFDKYDAEVWLERSLQAMQRFKVDKQDALEILKAVYVESQQNQLPPDLVLAVMEIESHFKRFAVSRVGAQGLMQVMPFWKDEIGRPHENLTNIKTNVRYGCKILAYYLEVADQNWSEALARYNGSYGRNVYSEKVLTVWGERWRKSSSYWFIKCVHTSTD